MKSPASSPQTAPRNRSVIDVLLAIPRPIPVNPAWHSRSPREPVHATPDDGRTLPGDDLPFDELPFTEWAAAKRAYLPRVEREHKRTGLWIGSFQVQVVLIGLVIWKLIAAPPANTDIGWAMLGALTCTTWLYLRAWRGSTERVGRMKDEALNSHIYDPRPTGPVSDAEALDTLFGVAGEESMGGRTERAIERQILWAEHRRARGGWNLELTALIVSLAACAWLLLAGGLIGKLAASQMGWVSGPVLLVVVAALLRGGYIWGLWFRAPVAISGVNAER